MENSESIRRSSIFDFRSRLRTGNRVLRASFPKTNPTENQGLRASFPNPAEANDGQRMENRGLRASFPNPTKERMENQVRASFPNLTEPGMENRVRASFPNPAETNDGQKMKTLDERASFSQSDEQELRSIFEPRRRPEQLYVNTGSKTGGNNSAGNNLLIKANEKAENDEWAWKNEGIFTIDAHHRHHMTQLPSYFPQHDQYDLFDGGLDRYKGIKSTTRCNLFRYFTFAELSSGCYDLLVPTMTDLTPDGGVKKCLLRKGDGDFVVEGCNMWMHYITFVEGNDEPIDTTRSKELLMAHKVGAGELILGVDIAVRSMKVGEVAKILLQSEYAYGKFGCPTLIPPNSRILMAIEIVKTSTESLEKPIFHLTARERAELGFDKIYDCAEELRQAGNRKFEFQKYYDAIERYEKAMEILEETLVFNQGDIFRRSELQFRLFANIAICHLRVDEPVPAIVACERALMSGMPKPKDAKIHYRYSEAAFILRRLEIAEEQINMALKFEPNRFEFLAFRRQIRAHMRRQEMEKDRLYKRMVPALLPTTATDGEQTEN